MREVTDEDFGALLREYRVKAEMTQAQLGEALDGVSAQAVALYEKGQRKMTAVMLTQAARALNVKVEKLIPPSK